MQSFCFCWKIVCFLGGKKRKKKSYNIVSRLGVIEEIFCSVLLEESLLENEMSITDLA